MKEVKSARSLKKKMCTPVKTEAKFGGFMMSGIRQKG